MKRFTVPCDFNGVKHPFHVYIGEPHPKKHPLQFQAWWLSTERGGTIPQDVMDSFEKLFKIAQENNVSFEDLCVYALGTAAEENSTQAASVADAQSPMDTPGMDDPQEEDDDAMMTPQEDALPPINESVPSPQSYAAPQEPQENVLRPIDEPVPPPRKFEDE